MCELKPFVFTTPGWYARHNGELRDVVYVVAIAPECFGDDESPTWFINTGGFSDFANRDGKSGCGGTLHGPCLGTDPERPPKPLVMRAMCWYDVDCLSHGKSVGFVTNKTTDGLWTIHACRRDGRHCYSFHCTDAGVSRFDEASHVLREHVGPLPWEAT